MRINHNISAVVTNNQLLGTEDSLSASMERLSSGLKINHASDNPAGMAIANKMNAQIRGLDQASQNSSDGTSVLETADGALKEVTEMIQRMRELSIQAANGLNSDAERDAIQVEVEALKAEIDRISETTEFNTKKLLDGSSDAHIYAEHCSRVQTNQYVAAGTYSFTVTAPATKAEIESNGTVPATITDTNTETIYDPSTGLPYSDAGNTNIKKTETVGYITGDPTGSFVDFIDGCTWDKTEYKNYFDKNKVFQHEEITNVKGQSGLAASGIVTINDIAVELKCGMSGQEVYMALRDAAEKAGAEISEKDEPLSFKSLEAGDGTNLKIAFSSEYIRDALGGFDTAAGLVVEERGTDPEITFDTTDPSQFSNRVTASYDNKTNRTTFTDTKGFEITLVLDDGFAENEPVDPDDASKGTYDGKITLNVTDIGVMDLQIGANEGQTMQVRITSTDCESLYIDNLNVSSARGADNAISQLDYALNKLTEVRSQIGAYTNRLEHTINSLDETEENMESAISRIQDVDMATEMVEYTKYNVLEQAGVSALSQANELPQLALQLLQN